MKKILYALVVMAGMVSISYGQTPEDEFQRNGKPLALIFTHFRTDFYDGETRPAFGITRAYLGYEYNFSPEFYAKIVLDVGDPKVGAFNMTAYLKNAYVMYKKGNLRAYFGMISTTQFKVSEKIWGYRYIEKSFQDAYKFNSSADIGFNIDYRFSDAFSMDFSVINGEGYKVIQNDEYVRPGLGITTNPFESITARIFADYVGNDVKQSSLATFVAYTSEKFVLGAEYNYQWNYDMVTGQDQFGPSVFATFIPSDNLKLFGRFDDLKSTTIEGESLPWNVAKDGRLIMVGLEFNPTRGVKLAPNFRVWNPYGDEIPTITSIFLNCELKF